jgi:hypothetical protein
MNGFFKIRRGINNLGIQCIILIIDTTWLLCCSSISIYIYLFFIYLSTYLSFNYILPSTVHRQPLNLIATTWCRMCQRKVRTVQDNDHICLLMASFLRTYIHIYIHIHTFIHTHIYPYMDAYCITLPITSYVTMQSAPIKITDHLSPSDHSLQLIDV